MTVPVRCPVGCDYTVKLMPSAVQHNVLAHLRVCPVLKDTNAGHPIYMAELARLADLHVEKSGGYGTSSDPFANFTAVSHMTGRPRFVYPVERDAEKATRFFSLLEQRRYGELGEELRDKASLNLCALAMWIEDGYSK